MVFNSIDFAVYFPVVFILYWFVFNRNLDLQNLFLVAASYVFYGWWDWRFLSLIIGSTIVDYFIGVSISKQKNKRSKNVLLLTSIIFNLGLLGFFKYSNFFLENFMLAFSFFGQQLELNSLKIILPVGISFYTFQTLSYTIDVYRGKLEPTTDYISFSGFVSFFPQLVAGPIERATHFLPQFYSNRTFDYNKAVDGMRQILWGLFKKMVIADNCARYVDLIFNNSSDYSGGTLAVGAFFFSFQIYCDFSGYSDIAIGTSRLLGFDLKKNFAFPYFSRDIAEFWRRWHISLSTWFRDYLYIPLGGSHGSTQNKIRNVLLIFLVSGFWHGAKWNFIFWGALHAFYFLPFLLLNKNRKNIDPISIGINLNSLKDAFFILMTFSLTTFAWIFFRAEDIPSAFSYIDQLFSKSFFPIAYSNKVKITAIPLLFFITVEWIGRNGNHALDLLKKVHVPAIRWLVYTALIMLISLYSIGGKQFIYFQF